jgi:hypothetical protein
MKPILLTLTLLLASSAFAQVPVLRCIEDVCDPVVKSQVQVTPAVLEGLKARQFVYVPQSDGPTVTIIPDPEPAHFVPPTYPLNNNSYPNTPFYPAFFPYAYPGFSEGFGTLYSQPKPVVVVVHEHEAPPVPLRPPAPPPPPASASVPNTGGLVLRRLKP